MSHEETAKDFARWVIWHTEDVATMGPCRRYKNRILNVDELYEAWIEFKKEKQKKF